MSSSRIHTSPPNGPNASAAPETLWLFRVPEWPFVVAVFAVVVLALYPYAFSAPFMADDFLFLQKTRHASFLDVWRFRELAFNYYRPWSRELHYWVLQGLFGTHELPFHLVSIALWVAVMTLYYAFVRRLHGTSVAAIAAAAVAALASWGVLVLWIAGVQDLWMLAFGLASLLLLSLGRVPWSAAAFGLALLSKETGAMVLPIAVAYLVLVERRPWPQALRRVLPHVLVALAWAVVHPQLGGRWLAHTSVQSIPGLHASAASILTRTLRAAVNVSGTLAPHGGWGDAIADALVIAVLLVFLVLRGAHGGTASSRPADSKSPPRAPGKTGSRAMSGADRHVVAFGIAWAVLGWLPLFAPSIGWHAYYGTIGTMGLWVAIAAVFAGHPRRAIPVVAALAVLCVAHASSPSFDWGDTWFQRRAAMIVSGTHAYLTKHYPTLPAHSRVYFSGVPVGAGLLPGMDPPVLRVWYGDTTLHAHFVSEFQPRPRGAAPGPDYFFAYDSTTGWHPQTMMTALPQHASAEQREDYATTLWNLGRFEQAAEQLKELAAESPQRIDLVFDVGSCYYHLGDSVQAARWYWRAAQYPGAPEGVLKPARRLVKFLRPGERDSIAHGLAPLRPVSDSARVAATPRPPRRS